MEGSPRGERAPSREKTEGSPGCERAPKTEGSPPGARTNLGDLKKKLLSALGAQVEGQYWALLRGYFAFKLTRSELDVLVPRTIGRDNLWLHNRFIRAIYNNAVSREAPAEERRAGFGKRGKKPQPVALPPLSREEESEEEPARVNGIVSHDPGRPARVGKRSKDTNKRKRTEPLVWEQKEAAAAAADSRLAPESGGAAPSGEPWEGTPTPVVKKRRKDRERRRAENRAPVVLDGETPTPKEPPATERPEEQPERAHVARVDDGDSEDDVIVLSREPVRPPLGIPFRAPSVGRSLMLRLPQKGFPRNQYGALLGEPYDNCLDGGELPTRPALQRRMAAIASAGAGVQSVSKESVELMEHALDQYLKSIMGTCVQLARARRERERGGKDGGAVTVGGGVPGGVESLLPAASPGVGDVARRMGDVAGRVGDVAGPCIDAPGVGAREEDELVSVRDLMAAVEINPQLLGDELAINLERIAMLL